MFLDSARAGCQIFLLLDAAMRVGDGGLGGGNQNLRLIHVLAAATLPTSRERVKTGASLCAPYRNAWRYRVRDRFKQIERYAVAICATSVCRTARCASTVASNCARADSFARRMRPTDQLHTPASRHTHRRIRRGFIGGIGDGPVLRTARGDRVPGIDRREKLRARDAKGSLPPATRARRRS